MAALSRRALLGRLAAAGVLAGLPRLSLAAAATDRRLVVVILRGALDGLAAVPPYGDRDYRTARGGLALAAPGGSGGIVDLDGFYGLNPALAPLHDFYARASCWSSMPSRRPIATARISMARTCLKMARRRRTRRAAAGS